MIFRLCGVVVALLVSTSALAFQGNLDYSPPGDARSYQRLSQVIKREPAGKTFQWLSTKEGRFLFPAALDPRLAQAGRISVSTKERWYCVQQVPAYCGPIKGINGQVFQAWPRYQWPKRVKPRAGK